MCICESHPLGSTLLSWLFFSQPIGFLGRICTYRYRAGVCDMLIEATGNLVTLRSLNLQIVMRYRVTW